MFRAISRLFSKDRPHIDVHNDWGDTLVLKGVPITLMKMGDGIRPVLVIETNEDIFIVYFPIGWISEFQHYDEDDEEW